MKEWCASGKRCNFIMGYDPDVNNVSQGNDIDDPNPNGERALHPNDVPEWYHPNNPLCNRGFDLGGILCNKCELPCHCCCQLEEKKWEVNAHLHELQIL